MDDRLVAVEDDEIGTVAEYYYDPFGRRLWKEVDGVRTYFVYCDEGLVGEYDSAGVELRTYGWAPNSQLATDPLFVKIANQYYWYQNDHLGTPQKIITSSGLVVWEVEYDSFGNAHIAVEIITNNLRFPGQYFDAETGLHYNWNRYYDPTTGRYLRTDPFGDGLNLYAYVFNNPVNWIDPLGFCAVDKTWHASKDLAFAAWATTTNLAGAAWNYFWYDWFFQFSDFTAGFGDTISFGATRQIRYDWNQAFGWQDSVNYQSRDYIAGKYLGFGWFVASGAVAAEAGSYSSLHSEASAAWGVTRSGALSAYAWAKPHAISLKERIMSSVLSQPIVAQNIADAVRTFSVPGTTPESFGDYIGAGARLLHDTIKPLVSNE